MLSKITYRLCLNAASMKGTKPCDWASVNHSKYEHFFKMY